MNRSYKSDDAYKTIGETAKELGLVDKDTGNLQTHTLRYWESQFKQIKPLIRAGKRRYYSKKDFKIIKLVQFLLKDKGLTIKGVKKILDENKGEYLDDNINLGVYKRDFEINKNIKKRIKKISKIIKELKEFK
tara:strand:- start:26 stop:424 length:399 start_codon:yes stop_codon:yes gene_type:complete